MPAKRFQGPVGEYEGLKYESARIRLRDFGLEALAIEALDRYFFDKEVTVPFYCPVSGCDGYFEMAGAHSTSLMTSPRNYLLPKALRCIFEQRKNDLEQEEEAVASKVRKIYKDWNEEGGEKRRELERGWIYQLDNDEAWDTGMKGTENELWEMFTMALDPTWISQ